ncbi:hypothetical protein At1g04090-like [Malania oleifera]|uniref:hypothetical protein At1g04090-like n=1 Tax=Malania oleifera TaxID=397392 RepID=UPI0025AE875E|nr:hypothetical protein At1g04090-like [Malania oleifera]
MGSCLFSSCGKELSSKSKTASPKIETTFKLPSPIPNCQPSEDFASGTIDLGGLLARQISSFTKVWATHEGGPDNLGATFFEPSPIPEEFFMLGCYCQPNNRPLFGWVLVAKDVNHGKILKQPVDYTLVWSSNSSKIKKDGDLNGYIWMPTPPEGYKAVGHVVTTSADKPSLEKVRCVHSDLTDDESETDGLIWGLGSRGFNVYGFRPKKRGIKAQGVCVGTFVAKKGKSKTYSLSLSCLKNLNPKFPKCSMPDLSQVEALFQAYSPLIYLHPKEQYLPSSVTWFFDNGALLYTKGQESKPVSIDPKGSNLPQDGSPKDGAYWMDLPVADEQKEKLKKGNSHSFEAYLHVKPMMGATFTDIAVWVFYPFNGPARAKVGCIEVVPLGKLGRHVGDWEHVSLRISNFNGQLWSVYFSQHSKGKRVLASEVEFYCGNRPTVYASLNGHAFYPRAGLVLQGKCGVGVRNDIARNLDYHEKVLDTRSKFVVVAVDYGSGTAAAAEEQPSEPPWLNYAREWGPKVSYLGKMKCLQVCGEEGPTGPKEKKNWKGDD